MGLTAMIFSYLRSCHKLGKIGNLWHFALLAIVAAANTSSPLSLALPACLGEQFSETGVVRVKIDRLLEML
jgi:hypothetical protein